jgi:hypothetical protein
LIHMSTRSRQKESHSGQKDNWNLEENSKAPRTTHKTTRTKD